MSKRLELIWPNKEKILLGLDENGKPIWGTKADLEPRLLVQLEAVGETNHDNLNDLYEQGDNLLIKGDNLLTLKALERHFAGRIKCIYIDPPFNTGNAFEHYDDGLEHTIWLSMMKARLEILKRLLHKEGMIFMQIDRNESAYLKVLMDEIFGRAINYITTIVIRMSGTSGYKIEHADKTIVKNTEYIHVYSRSEAFKIKPQFERIGYDNHYSIFIYEKDGAYYFRTLVSEVKDLFKKVGIDSKNDNLERLFELSSDFQDFVFKNKDRIARTHTAPAEVINKLSEFRKLFKADNQIIPYKSISGDNYLLKLTPENINQVIPISEKIRQVYEFDYLGEWLSNILGDWWDNFYKDMGNVEKEGGVELKASKKPERLLHRIIEMTTDTGDWVLDSFLGSGTTAAVAHKLGRRWIGIELGEHAETLCLPRLKRVVSGEDQTGISKQVGWKGGGGFRYCVLGESIFAKDKDTGLVMINPKYTNGPLVAAVCNMEDFRFNNDGIFQGVRGNIYAHITEEKVTQAYLDALLDQLPNNKSLTVYCLKRSMDLKMPEEIKIKRIPKELQIPRYLLSMQKGGA